MLNTIPGSAVLASTAVTDEQEEKKETWPHEAIESVYRYGSRDGSTMAVKADLKVEINDLGEPSLSVRWAVPVATTGKFRELGISVSLSDPDLSEAIANEVANAGSEAVARMEAAIAAEEARMADLKAKLAIASKRAERRSAGK